MGATNEIKETNLSLQLDNKKCPQCLQVFTQQEINDQNYEVWFDTTNDVKLTPMEELKEDAYYKPFGRTGYELTIWIRSIEHEYCPETNSCEGCGKRFLTEQMKYVEYDTKLGNVDEYYCPPCWNKSQELKDHE